MGCILSLIYIILYYFENQIWKHIYSNKIISFNHFLIKLKFKMEIKQYIYENNNRYPLQQEVVIPPYSPLANYDEMLKFLLFQ